MATLNGGRWLDDQLGSIAAQQGCDWALCIGDDGSTDDTCARVTRFAARHPGRDIRLHRGGGRGAAANFLALLARPDLPLGPDTHVALADQDDIWLPRKLARATARLAAAGPGPAIYGAQSLHVDAQGRITGRSRPPQGEVTLARALVQNPVRGHALVLNPAAVRLARRAGAPGVAFHDWWLALLVLACGGRAVIDRAVVLHYRQHRGNLLGGAGGIRAGLRRAGLLGRGEWRRWLATNRDALAALPAAGVALDPGAQALLGALADAPASGPARVAAFARAGLRRDRRVENAVLRLCLLAGLA